MNSQILTMTVAVTATMALGVINLSGCTSHKAQLAGSPANAATPDPLAAGVGRILREATAQPRAYQHLVQLCDGYGHRLSGSKALEDAIDWSLAKMRKLGLENVHREKVMIPAWVRGKESAVLISPKVSGRQRPIVMLGLGMSVGTPAEGLTGEVLVVADEAELKAKKLKSRAESSCSTTRCRAGRVSRERNTARRCGSELKVRTWLASWARSLCWYAP